MPDDPPPSPLGRKGSPLGHADQTLKRTADLGSGRTLVNEPDRGGNPVIGLRKCSPAEAAKPIRPQVPGSDASFEATNRKSGRGPDQQ